MTREEYEQRKRGLEDRLREGIQTLQEAYRLQVRALDLIWMSEAEPERKISLPETTQGGPPALPAPPQAPLRATRRKAGELYLEVQDALDGVPEVFNRGHLCEQLGYEPDRSSLYRVLESLVEEGILTVEFRGEGRAPSRYRKTAAASRLPDA